MEISRRLVTVLAVVVCLLAATVALAEPTPVKGWYLAPGLGINWLDQEADHPQPADAGYRLSAAIGRRFSRRWALELETGYLSNTMPATERRAEGTLTQVPMVFNLIHTLPFRSALKPCLGVGLGVVFASDRGDSGGDVAVQFLVGARHALGQRTSLGFGYRFIMLSASSALASEPVGDDTLLLDLRLAL
jgi:hypothetical protein